MQEANIFVVNAGQNEYSLFNFATLAPIRSLKGPPPIVRYPRQVCFAEDGQKVVGGTDCGKALLFETATGKLIQRLDYTPGGLVQPIAVRFSLLLSFVHQIKFEEFQACTLTSQSIIAMAGSSSAQPSQIFIWRRTTGATYWTQIFWRYSTMLFILAVLPFLALLIESKYHPLSCWLKQVEFYNVNVCLPLA